MLLRKVTSLLYAGLFVCGSMTCSIPKAEKIEFKILSQSKPNDKIKNIKDIKNEAKQIKQKRDEEARLEQERLLQEEIKRKEQEEQMRIKNLGRRIKFHITYYCDANNSLEGGKRDKKGRNLDSHEYPVLAMPSDVSYGAKITFDEEVNGSREYINIDTGSAICWLNDNCTECKVDIFIGGVSSSWIERNMRNRIVYGYLKE